MCYNEQDFLETYPYEGGAYSFFPQEYPCIVDVNSVDIGIMGEGKQVDIYYIPEGINSNLAFLAGLEAEVIDSYII